MAGTAAGNKAAEKNGRRGEEAAAEEEEEEGWQDGSTGGDGIAGPLLLYIYTHTSLRPG